MPSSITINEPHSPANILRQLRPYDSNLSGELSTPASNFSRTKDYCIIGINSSHPIEDLFNSTMPIDLDDVRWDYELGQGSRSLARRGFYKIIGQPRKVMIGTIPTWCATVLYQPSPNYNTVFKFCARIGPLVNQQALGFDLSPAGPSFIRAINPADKERYLRSMIGQTFYVSQQRRISRPENMPYDLKETVWFKFI